MLSQLGRAKGHDPRTLQLQSERSTEPHIGNRYKKEREKKEEKGEREGEKGREGEKRRREMREGGPHIANKHKKREKKGEREKKGR